MREWTCLNLRSSAINVIQEFNSVKRFMAKAPTLKPRLQLAPSRVLHQASAATERTRGTTWQHARRAQLQREPLCRHCAGRGLVELAREVDHVRPLADGGTDDPDNLQSLCIPCHAVKTRTDIARLRGL